MLWNWYTIDACECPPRHVVGAPPSLEPRIRLIHSSTTPTNLLSDHYSPSGIDLGQWHRCIYHNSSKNGRSVILPQVVSHSILIFSTNFAMNLVTDLKPLRLTLRAKISQQAMRATLHVTIHGCILYHVVPRTIYNGYVIICIIIGAWLGAFFLR